MQALVSSHVPGDYTILCLPSHDTMWLDTQSHDTVQRGDLVRRDSVPSPPSPSLCIRTLAIGCEYCWHVYVNNETCFKNKLIRLFSIFRLTVPLPRPPPPSFQPDIPGDVEELECVSRNWESLQCRYTLPHNPVAGEHDYRVCLLPAGESAVSCE